MRPQHSNAEYAIAHDYELLILANVSISHPKLRVEPADDFEQLAKVSQLTTTEDLLAQVSPSITTTDDGQCSAQHACYCEPNVCAAAWLALPESSRSRFVIKHIVADTDVTQQVSSLRLFATFTMGDRGRNCAHQLASQPSPLRSGAGGAPRGDAGAVPRGGASAGHGEGRGTIGRGGTNPASPGGSPSSDTREPQAGGLRTGQGRGGNARATRGGWSRGRAGSTTSGESRRDESGGKDQSFSERKGASSVASPGGGKAGVRGSNVTLGRGRGQGRGTYGSSITISATGSYPSESWYRDGGRSRGGYHHDRGVGGFDRGRGGFFGGRGRGGGGGGGEGGFERDPGG